jgi:hypothetical protein
MILDKIKGNTNWLTLVAIISITLLCLEDGFEVGQVELKNGL